MACNMEAYFICEVGKSTACNSSLLFPLRKKYNYSLISIDNYFQLLLTFVDQILRKKQQPFVPTPIGIWELSKSSLIEETKNDMDVTKNNIGIDPLWAPGGSIGSPLLSSFWSPANDPITSSLIVDYKHSTPSWSGITVIFWLRFDKTDIATKKIFILVSIRNLSMITI